MVAPDGKIVIAPLSPTEYYNMKKHLGELAHGLEGYFEWQE